MYRLADYDSALKMAELFPDFEIIEPGEYNIKSTLEECTEMMNNVKIDEKKNKNLINKIIYDPISYKLKKTEYDRSQRNRNYEEESAIADGKKVVNKSLIRSFFKSKV